MSSEHTEAAAPSPTRRPGRGDGGAPVTGALTIVLAVIAVIAGFLILRSITGDGGGAVGPSGSTTTVPGIDPDATSSSVPETAPPTTEAPNVFTGATVVVANANNVNGSAGQMSRALEAAGFTMGEPTNAAASVGQLDATVIYFEAGNDAARAVAETVNRLMGGDSSLSPLPATPPTASGTLDAGVLVVLGKDKAGKSLEELAPAPAVPSPGVAGDDADDAADPDG